MKTCSICKESKKDDCFHIRSVKHGKTLRNTYCIPCQKVYHRKHYIANKDKYKKKAFLYKKETKRTISEFKEGKMCCDCLKIYPPWVMDYDHREDEIKLNEVSRLAGVSISKAMKEIEKCDLVCSNCHRQRTHDRFIKNKGLSSNGQDG